MVFIGSTFWRLMLKENSDGSGPRGLWTIDGHGRPSDIHDTWKQWCSQTVLSSLCAYVVFWRILGTALTNKITSDV